MWKENLGTQAGVHLIAGVCLIWGPLNTGFTVVLLLKVKNDPRSEFSNLSNWKEEA